MQKSSMAADVSDAFGVDIAGVCSVYKPGNAAALAVWQLSHAHFSTLHTKPPIIQCSSSMTVRVKTTAAVCATAAHHAQAK